MRCAPLLFLIATALDAAPLFTDITRAAGIDYTNESGGADKHYIIESQAAGGGFLDPGGFLFGGGSQQQLCRDFERGVCRRGAGCRFHHDSEPPFFSAPSLPRRTCCGD